LFKESTSDLQDKKFLGSQAWWLMSVIPATQEAESRRIAVQSQPGRDVCKTLSRKINLITKRAGGVAQGVAPEFKFQYYNNNNKRQKKFLGMSFKMR
jgi:hypothetical protein